MATPEITVEEREATQDNATCCCGGVRAGRALGLALLSAAIIVPAVIYYLSKHLWTKRAAEPEHRSQRITIPVQVVHSDEEDREDAATLRIAPTRAAAVEIVATQTEMASFVGSTESDKFHVPGCRWAQNIDATNRISFPSREAALDQGYVACNTCRP